MNVQTVLQKSSHSGGGVPHISVKLPMLGGGGVKITFVVVRKDTWSGG